MKNTDGKRIESLVRCVIRGTFGPAASALRLTVDADLRAACVSAKSVVNVFEGDCVRILEMEFMQRLVCTHVVLGKISARFLSDIGM